MERLFTSLLPFSRQGLEGQLAAKALQKGSSAPPAQGGHRLPPHCFPTCLCSGTGSKPTQSTTCTAPGCTAVLGGSELPPATPAPDLQCSLSPGALPLGPSFTPLHPSSHPPAPSAGLANQKLLPTVGPHPSPATSPSPRPPTSDSVPLPLSSADPETAPVAFRGRQRGRASPRRGWGPRGQPLDPSTAPGNSGGAAQPGGDH